MVSHTETWEILGIRELAATDERAEEFTGTLLVYRPGATEPLETIRVSARRAVLAELEAYVSRLLKRSRGLRR